MSTACTVAESAIQGSGEGPAVRRKVGTHAVSQLSKVALKTTTRRPGSMASPTGPERVVLSCTPAVSKPPEIQRRPSCVASADSSRIELRNLPTSSLRRLLSRDSDCAAESTSEEDAPAEMRAGT